MEEKVKNERQWKVIGDNNDIINNGGLLVRHIFDNVYQVIEISPRPDDQEKVLAGVCDIDIEAYAGRKDIFHFAGYDALAGSNIEVIKEIIGPECFAADIVSCVGLENLDPLPLYHDWFASKSYVEHWLMLMGWQSDTNIPTEVSELTIGKLRNYINQLPNDMDDEPVFVGCQGNTNFDFMDTSCKQDTIATIHNNKLFIIDSISIEDENGVPI